MAALATFTGVYLMTPVADHGGAAADSPTRLQQLATATYYPNCKAAWAAGAAPIYAGQPGYREGLDGDSDGIACEPYRGY